MTFSDKLNEYIQLLGCTAKDLARRSGISASLLSRWRSGKVIPAPESEQLRKLAGGIAALSAEQGLPLQQEELILSSFAELLESIPEDCRQLSARLDTMLSSLALQDRQLARSIHMDPEAFTSIRGGSRSPMDPEAFSFQIASGILRCEPEDTALQQLAELMNLSAEDLSDPRFLHRSIRHWLYPHSRDDTNAALSFLQLMDTFDTEEYLESLQFSRQKLPSFSRPVSGSRIYYGCRESRRGEIDFLKTVLLSKTGGAVYFFSDVPVSAHTRVDFNRRWLLVLALALKKGLHIHLILSEDHPNLSFLPGMKHWIPLLLAGKLTPYILKNAGSSVFRHCCLVSDKAALNGECLADQVHLGNYYLTTNKEELAFFQRKIKALLDQAEPLLTVYRRDAQSAYEAFMTSDLHATGRRRAIYAALPLFTMKKEMLVSLLQRHEINGPAGKRLLSYAAAQRNRMEQMLLENTLEITIPDLTEEEFLLQPLFLPFAEAFFEKDIPYTYADYLSHLRQTREYAAKHPSLRLHIHRGYTFLHVNLALREDNWAVISGFSDPALKFLIQYPRLLEHLEHVDL